MLRFTCITDNVFYQRLRGFASHKCKFQFDSMYGGIDTPYCSNNMKIEMKDPWMSDSL